MSGFADFPGSDVRARLDHPVIDCDAHVVEARFAIEDFLKDLAGYLRTNQPNINGITIAPLQAKYIADKVRLLVALEEIGRARLETGLDVLGRTPILVGHW